jgi:hypothetical protein
MARAETMRIWDQRQVRSAIRVAVAAGTDGDFAGNGAVP